MTDYEYECVKVRVQNGVAWTALNRPEKRNAMSPQLHYDMDAALAPWKLTIMPRWWWSPARAEISAPDRI